MLDFICSELLEEHALLAISALSDLVSKGVVTAVLIVKDVTILEMMDSTLIVTSHVDCAHCALFSISNPDVIIVKMELILAKEIAKVELLNVKNVVNKKMFELVKTLTSN